MKKPGKSSAFDSGMRGKEKPAEANGGESEQKPGGSIGDPKGVGLDAYSSGMRGSEKPKEKAAADPAATLSTGDAGGAGSSRQAANSSVGNPKGEDTSKGVSQALPGGQAQSHTSNAYEQGTPGNNLESSSAGHEPSFEEDDTHVNIRVPKTAFKRKQAQ